MSQLKYVIIFLLLVAASRATPPDPVLDPLVQAAIESSPELASARAETEAARRRINPAGTLPDPTVSMMYDGDRNMTTVSLSQVIPWPGKRDVATRAAEHDALAMEHTLIGRASLVIEARVRTAWYELAAARETRSLVDERARTAQQIEETARQRYATGLGMQQDVLRAQVEIARLGAERAEQDAVITARTAELQRLVASANADLAKLPDTNAPLSIAVMKEQLRILAGAHPMSPQGFERVQDLRRAVYDSDDSAERVAAFLEKRKPVLRGC